MIQLNDPIIELFKSFSLEWSKLFKIPESYENQQRNGKSLFEY